MGNSGYSFEGGERKGGKRVGKGWGKSGRPLSRKISRDDFIKSYFERNVVFFLILISLFFINAKHILVISKFRRLVY